ncbi:MAG TPA: peptide MFS transporter [Gemmatimonadaceae bacterium]|nr:peptide MFS transporter [Gemmatimonadaceae bacterium]
MTIDSTISKAATALDRPPILDDQSLFGHPRGLGLLFIVEMWERFSFYGMRALLVLYLVNALQWPDGDAARLYGSYTGLVYLTPVIGGWLADRFLGTSRSMIIGGLLITLGHFALAFGPDVATIRPGGASMVPFYVGLGLVIIGTGFFKPNVSTMVGQIYRPGDDRRDAGFTIFYMGINLGAFIAPLICGYLGQRVGWHYGFGAAGVGMLLGLLVYMRYRDRYLPGIGVIPNRSETVMVRDATPTAGIVEQGVEGRGNLFRGAGGAVVGLAVALLAGSGVMGMLYGVLIGASLAVTILGTHGEERRRVIALFIVFFFVIFFWMAFEQAGSSMNLFADRYTDLSVGTFEIPSTWFQSVNSFFILLFAPVFAIMWRNLARSQREPPTAMKMVLGLFLLGLGFVFLVIGARGVDACLAAGEASCNIASPIWLILAFLFHTLGELALSPVGLSYVTKVAPWRFVSLLMGLWFLSTSAANYLGGHLAAMTETIASQSRFFMIPVATSIGAAVVMLVLVPLLRRLTSSVKA